MTATYHAIAPGRRRHKAVTQRRWRIGVLVGRTAPKAMVVGRPTMKISTGIVFATFTVAAVGCSKKDSPKPPAQGKPSIGAAVDFAAARTRLVGSVDAVKSKAKGKAVTHVKAVPANAKAKVAQQAL